MAKPDSKQRPQDRLYHVSYICKYGVTIKPSHIMYSLTHQTNPSYIIYSLIHQTKPQLYYI